MEKTFKDYAHLYLGCDVLVQNLDSDDFETEIEEGITNGCVAKLTLVNQGDCQLRAYDDSENWEYAIEIEGACLCSWWSSRNVRPLLRQLSDITKDEAVELWGHKNAFAIMNNSFNYDEHLSNLSPYGTVYLLKQGFDLFNLIESGIALDKTKL